VIDATVPVVHDPRVADRESSASRTPSYSLRRDWLAIWNPSAGGGRIRAWRRFERAFAGAGLRLDVARTGSPGEATQLAERAVRAGVRQLLVAGGDGTVHEVVNGIMRARDGTHDASAAPLLVPVPLGTGNDWARTLGLSRDPQTLGSTVAAQKALAWHDVGRMQFDAQPADPRWFVNVAGAGFDAHVVDAMPARVPSRLSYLLHVLRRLGRYRSPWFRLDPDDSGPLEGRYLLAFVAIGRYCGHRMQVAPTARPDDGLFDLVTIDEVTLVRALPKLLRLYRGTILDDPLVRHRRVRSLHVDAEPAAPVEADGQFVGRTPVTFTVEPRALRVLCAR
jgi:diacylglycerol kinase (ATP)